jgi:hypothetical protein
MVVEEILWLGRAEECRQATYSVVIGIASLVAGWLLSAVSPISIASLLQR